ncbi:MAG: hypothetical protein QXH30_00095 [Candidatus Bilamarchaeaceae archaeon]
MTAEINGDSVALAANVVWHRFEELVLAPANYPQMLWFSVPLLFAMVIVAFYFGRYRKEELGWGTALENSMIFLFVSIDIVREMYESTEPHSWMNIMGNPLYLSITAGLAGFSIFSMLLIYYHLLPKRLTFFLFSKVPVSIALYVIMTIVYAGVPADWNTVAAGVLLFLIVWLIVKSIHFFQHLTGMRHVEAEREAEKMRQEEEEEGKKRREREKKRMPQPGEEEG